MEMTEIISNGKQSITVATDRSKSIANDESKVEAKIKKKESGSVLTMTVVLYALIVSIGGVIGGYSHGFPSPTLIDLQTEYDKGERVTAFPSHSFYAGLFGVSVLFLYTLTNTKL